jgi:GGDEF domain-containing protein
MKLITGDMPDQYYVITSRLTAQGHQRTAMRVVAGCILALSLPAFFAAIDPNSAAAPGGRTLPALVPLACAAMATPWLRYRWPSRAQSAAVVVLGTLLLAGGCLLTRDPLIGLLTATAFPFAIGYSALFHGPRIQGLVATTAAATVTWLASRIATSDLPKAVEAATPVILINIAVLTGCRIIAKVATADGERTDVEPLTGLLNRSSFDELAAALLGARNRDDDRFLVVTVISIDNVGAVMSLQGRRGIDRARIAVAQALRDTVRRDALVGHVDDADFLVADVFTNPDPTPLAERIRGAVAAAPGGLTASIGVVSTPLGPLAARPPYDVLDEVIPLAATAVHQARRRGGNRAEYLLDPPLDGPTDADPGPGQD